jgi:uncharacterized protein YecT (DUF1311 family)
VIRAAALALAFGLAAPALAQSGRGDVCPEVASDGAGFACLQGLVSAQERRLAEVWKRVFAGFGGSRTAAGQRLLAEQRAWIAFKDRACALYFLPGQSNLELSNGQRCRAATILDRVSQLERLEADFPGQD